MKKILFITTTYVLKNSSAAIRNNSLVRGLVDLGFMVDVCTIQWSKELFSPFFEKEQNGDIHYSQLPSLIRIAQIKQAQVRKHNNKWLVKLRQLLKKVLLFPDECYEWPKKFEKDNLDQYMCLITSSDHKTSHFVGLKMKRQKPSIPWIQIWGDPWSTDVNTLPFMKSLISHYEKRLLKAADKIIYVSEATRHEMQSKYPQLSDKMYYIPRGYYFEVNAHTLVRNKIRIVYTGVLSYGRNPFALLSVINSLKLPLSDCVIEFYGDMPFEMKEKMSGYSFVQFHESVDFEYMPDVLASASILLYLSNKKGSTQIPGKLFDYMGTTKPILCLVSDKSDPMSLFLKQFERCLVLDNIESTIMENWDRIEKLCNQKFTPESQFSRKNVAAQVVKLLN